jgi:hypothetical protein
MENFQRVNVVKYKKESWYSNFQINNAVIEEIHENYLKIVFDEKTTKNGEPTFGGGLFYTDVYEITPL